MSLMLIAAILAAGTLGGLTDWLFMGVLFHEAYDKYPEVWWPGIRGGKELGPIIWSSLLGYIMTAGVVALCVLASVRDIRGGLTVAGVAWLAGPFVILVVNGFFIKTDPKITVAHCLGWLARMALAGLAAGLVLPTA